MTTTKAEIRYEENSEIKTRVVDYAAEDDGGLLGIYESDSRFARKIEILNMRHHSFISIRWFESGGDNKR